jgi:putative endonuclease
VPAAYRVYVLQNREERFYVGLSEDVGKRVGQHNLGDSKWTRGRGPWILIWQSEEMNLSEARKLENRLKRQGRGAGFYTITGLPQRSRS